MVVKQSSCRGMSWALQKWDVGRCDGSVEPKLGTQCLCWVKEW